MKLRLGDVLNVSITVALAAVTGVTTWFFTRESSKPSSAPATTPPSKVSSPLKEPELIVVTLTADAERRLGLQVQPIERRNVPRVRTYGGDVVHRPGNLVMVPAPLSGTLMAATQGELLVGRKVKRGEPVFRLTPLLTPDARANIAASLVDAEGQVKSAQTQVDAAQIALQRAKQLFNAEAGSKRAVDDAQAQYDLARKLLEAAQARRSLFGEVANEADSGSVPSLVIASPVDGLLRNVLALAGEAVPAGAALFEVINLDTVWVRVPVYVGELDEVNREMAARVGHVAARPGDQPWSAQPVAAPPSANALAATVDLFYELENTTSKLAPGQRVAATLTLRGDKENLVVPWSAVIHDIHGGTWVYERTSPQKYTRLRVLVRHVIGELAVIEDGPKPGTAVVTAGAAELFGTEVGFAK